MRRTEFIDIEHRGFDNTDMMLVGDGLLAAMVADDTVADAWEDDIFVGLGFEATQDAMARIWRQAKRVSLCHLNRQFWLLNIERNAS
jgi:hypothetical protein